MGEKEIERGREDSGKDRRYSICINKKKLYIERERDKLCGREMWRWV